MNRIANAWLTLWILMFVAIAMEYVFLRSVHRELITIASAWGWIAILFGFVKLFGVAWRETK